MTIQPRDPRGRFLPAMPHEDAARIAGAAPHIDPVRPAHGHMARAYFPDDPIPQSEIDAGLRRSVWYRGGDWPSGWWIVPAAVLGTVCWGALVWWL